MALPNPWIVQWSTAISVARYQGLKQPVLIITTKKCYHFEKKGFSVVPLPIIEDTGYIFIPKGMTT